jgi:hypothetical protein
MLYADIDFLSSYYTLDIPGGQTQKAAILLQVNLPALNEVLHKSFISRELNHLAVPFFKIEGQLNSAMSTNIGAFVSSA